MVTPNSWGVPEKRRRIAREEETNRPRRGDEIDAKPLSLQDIFPYYYITFVHYLYTHTCVKKFFNVSRLTMPVSLQPQSRKVQPQQDDPQFQIIRTETVFSRYPVHNLSKKGSIDIHITKKNAHGELTLEWKVSPSRDHGEPRQLAYRLDTLVINRRIDELSRPLPKVIRLGSLRDIAKELNLGNDTPAVKRALSQNASAFITAKLRYKDKNKIQRRVEIQGTRYTLAFYGMKLPDGRTADAVYLILNDAYWEVLNYAKTRPLDYDYLKALPPGSQRFYEIISYRIYTALLYGYAEAKLTYSDYCIFSAQQRYYDYNRFKKQMYKIHDPHLKSAYITHVRYEATTDSDGKLDWIMLYTPGQRAAAEFGVFKPKELEGADTYLHEGDTRKEENQAQQSDPDKNAAILVKYFYHLFHGTTAVDPSTKERDQALDLIAKHGLERAHYIVDYAHQVAPGSHYEPQFFGGILPFTSRAIADYDATQRRRQAQEAIKVCTLCNDQGWISYIEANGHSFVAHCPHDLQQIQARERAENLRRNP